MIGNVHISGQIGSSYNENGTIAEKGVELIDVINQVESMKDCEIINVWINSPGGLVSVGNDIHNYLSKKKNVVTIADGFCASIATKIHLSVPVHNRKIVTGTEYMIHNPLFSEVSNVNANDLKALVLELEPIQKDLVNMYSKQTGTSKDAIQALMDVEASLTNEQLISLGFVSEVINKPAFKAVAFVDPKKVVTKKEDEMSNIKLNLLQKAMAKLNGREVKAIVETVEQGTIETPFSDLMVGDPIMLDGAPAPAGEYVLADGTKIEVEVEGIIGAIEMASDVPPVDPAMALQEEIEALKGQLTEREEIIALMETEHEATANELETLKNEILASKKSTFKVPSATAQFRGQKTVATLSPKEAMEARRAEYKSKK